MEAGSGFVYILLKSPLTRNSSSQVGCKQNDATVANLQALEAANKSLLHNRV